MSQRRHTYCLSDGTIVTDVLGADGADEDAEDTDDDDDDDDDDDSDADDDDDNDDDDDDDSSKDKKRKSRTELEAELVVALAAVERATRRMKRADRAKSKTVNELNALKNGDKKELADAQAKIEELEKQVAEAAGTDTKTLVREEFRDLSDFSWHNPKLAFSLLNLDEVDVDDDGNVDVASLTDAAKQLATEHPYLVKKAESSKDDDDDDDEDDKEQGGRSKRSGSPMNGRKRTPQQKSQAQIKDKFPIIQGRF